MTAVFGSVMTERSWISQPGFERFDRQLLRCQSSLATRYVDCPPVDQLKQLGRVAGDKIDDMRLQRRVRR